MPKDISGNHARIAYTVQYGMDGLFTGRTWNLPALFGKLGAFGLSAVFKNGAGYLPENFRKFIEGWTGQGPEFGKTISLPAPSASSIEARLDFARNELSMKAGPQNMPEGDFMILKKFALAEIKRLHAMATAHELSRKEFEGRARWTKAVAYFDSNGDWVEEYEMEAAQNWGNH